MPATQIAETRFIARGMAAGLAGGFAAFVFARLFAEPIINQAIAYESGRDAAMEALSRAAGNPPAPMGPDLFSRGIQGSVGVGFGLVVFGFALGGIISVLYVMASRRWPQVKPRPLALFVALALFTTLYLIPFLKYPANPPAIGHPESIRQRSEVYLAMVVISIIAFLAAAVSARRLTERFGAWNGTLLAALGFAVVVGVAMVLLPTTGELSSNLLTYGRHATETPGVLKNTAGQIVYPGFPADTLAKFRLVSVGNQVVMWGTIGLVYGVLVERMIAGAVAKDRAATAPARDPEAALSA